MRELIIADRRIADDTPAWVVAEIGNNHQGELQKARDLIQAAAYAGVDAVKFQKRDNRSLYTAEMYDAPYTSEHAFGPTYGAHREALEFGEGEYAELKGYAGSLGLVFFATAFDIPSADVLERLGVPAFKIASGDLRSIPLIRHVAGFGKPVIVSTGGGTMEDVATVVDALPGADAKSTRQHPIAILQCTAAYPVAPQEMNLRVIETYRERFPDTVIGLSDHYDGIMPAPVAFALGARIFEKHFTLDHNWKGSDHRFSLEPEGMRRMVRDLKAIREALGDGVKRPYESEAAGLLKMSKSLVAARDLPAGHILVAADIEMRSPGGGASPADLPAMLGSVLPWPMKAGEQFTRHFKVRL